jgi:hypothetical protein
MECRIDVVVMSVVLYFLSFPESNCPTTKMRRDFVLSDFRCEVDEHKGRKRAWD